MCKSAGAISFTDLAGLKDGFTLIELLVVVSIAAMLLAVLSPALDRAMYAAQLAVCGSNLKAIAGAVNIYAGEQRRHYPYRQALDPNFAPRPRWMRPDVLVDTNNATGVNSQTAVGDAVDDRPPLRSYFDDRFSVLHDPLTGGDIDFTIADHAIYADYNLWWRMNALPSVGGGRGLMRLGDRFEWLEVGYDVLASDRDSVRPGTTGFQKAWASHPDPAGDLQLLVAKVSGSWFLAWWESSTTYSRSPLDLNHAYTDGSVERFNAVRWDDPRMGRLPFNRFDTFYARDDREWFHAPRR